MSNLTVKHYMYLAEQQQHDVNFPHVSMNQVTSDISHVEIKPL